MRHGSWLAEDAGETDQLDRMKPPKLDEKIPPFVPPDKLSALQSELGTFAAAQNGERILMERQTQTCEDCGGSGWKRIPGSERYHCRSCHGQGCVPLVTPSCPRCGATAPAIFWLGGPDDNIGRLTDAWRCGDCQLDWEAEPS